MLLIQQFSSFNPFGKLPHFFSFENLAKLVQEVLALVLFGHGFKVSPKLRVVFHVSHLLRLATEQLVESRYLIVVKIVLVGVAHSV